MTSPLLTATTTATDPTGLLLLAALVWITWRVLSRLRWPYPTCRTCHGSGKHHNPTGERWRSCPRCGGTGTRHHTTPHD